MTDDGNGWTGVGWQDWQDADTIVRYLERGADPEAWRSRRPLHLAAQFGSPQVVAELARRVVDVDALQDGTTALWEAVVSGRADNARVLAAAGADPWRVLIGGWSPGLFAVPEGESGLSEAESAAARASKGLLAALGGLRCDGTGLACVAGIDAQEAVARMEARSVPDRQMAELLEAPWAYDVDESLRVVGVTTVTGGCVVTQPWGYAPTMSGLLARLSAGTVCYGVYANPKSGNQGSTARDGTVEAWDLHPGGGPQPHDTPEEVLASYLYHGNAVAYACAYTGLRPADRRAVLGPPDTWVRLPQRDHWTH